MVFEGIKKRWDNRGKQCLKCQKKLVGKEKWVCQKCRTDMSEGGVIALIVTGLTGIFINSNSKKS